jgi:glycine cleavage system H protein
VIVVRGCEFPEELQYHVEHNVWLRREADGAVTVGVTQYASFLAGDFLAFVPKRIGTDVERNRGIGVLEISKTITSVRAPLSGTIVATNAEAEVKPWLINNDPYGVGWLVKLAPSAWDAQRAALLSGEAIIAAFERAMDLERFLGPGIDRASTDE